MHVDHSRLSEPLVVFPSATILAPGLSDKMVQRPQTSASAVEYYPIQLGKVETWWRSQPTNAVDTIQRVAIMSGIPLTLLQKNFDADQLLRVLNIAISMAN